MNKENYNVKNWLDVTRGKITANPNEFCYKIYLNPNVYLKKAPKKPDLKNVIYYLLQLEIKKNIIKKNNDRKGKRRKHISALNYILMADYWYKKMPNEYIEKIKKNGTVLHNDHLIPFTTKTNFEITLDRLGNFSPIMSKINCGRGSAHIDYYWKKNNVKEIIKFLDIFPKNNEYNHIVTYNKSGSNKVPHLISEITYNCFCENNEKKYIDSFLKDLY